MKALENIVVVGTEGTDESNENELSGWIHDRRAGDTIPAWWGAAYKEMNSFDNYCYDWKIRKCSRIRNKSIDNFNAGTHRFLLRSFWWGNNWRFCWNYSLKKTIKKDRNLIRYRKLRETNLLKKTYNHDIETTVLILYPFIQKDLYNIFLNSYLTTFLFHIHVFSKWLFSLENSYFRWCLLRQTQDNKKRSDERNHAKKN